MIAKSALLQALLFLLVGSSSALIFDWFPKLPPPAIPWIPAIGDTCTVAKGNPQCGLGFIHQRFLMCNVKNQIEICTRDPPENAKSGFICGACTDPVNYFWKYDP